MSGYHLCSSVQVKAFWLSRESLTGRGSSDASVATD